MSDACMYMYMKLGETNCKTTGAFYRSSLLQQKLMPLSVKDIHSPVTDISDFEA